MVFFVVLPPRCGLNIYTHTVFFQVLRQQPFAQAEGQRQVTALLEFLL
jgi:hypothetical protein